jgi:hypothetical protein
VRRARKKREGGAGAGEVREKKLDRIAIML